MDLVQTDIARKSKLKTKTGTLGREYAIVKNCTYKSIPLLSLTFADKLAEKGVLIVQKFVYKSLCK
jgi:hypothetical protein